MVQGWDQREKGESRGVKSESEAHGKAAGPGLSAPRSVGSIHQMHLHAEYRTALLAQATSLKPFFELFKIEKMNSASWS